MFFDVESRAEYVENTHYSRKVMFCGQTRPRFSNSGLRTESIAEYAKNIQLSLRENPLEPGEEYTSWDVKSFYDRLDADLFHQVPQNTLK